MPKELNRSGTSVRFPLDDLEDYRLMGKHLYGLPASKLIQAITAELVESVARSSLEEIGLAPSGLLKTLFQSVELRAICNRIFARGERELSSSETQSISVGFSPEQAEVLTKVANVLRWPLGKLVQQAMRDALLIVANKGGESDIPVIAKFYLGITLVEKSMKTGLRNRFDETLKKWRDGRVSSDGGSEDQSDSANQSEPWVVDEVGITEQGGFKKT